jgi:hypothetical protein
MCVWSRLHTTQNKTTALFHWRIAGESWVQKSNSQGRGVPATGRRHQLIVTIPSFINEYVAGKTNSEPQR